VKKSGKGEGVLVPDSWKNWLCNCRRGRFFFFLVLYFLFFFFFFLGVHNKARQRGALALSWGVSYPLSVSSHV